MNNFFIDNLYTVILCPMWIFLLIIIGRFFNVVQSRRVISILTLLSSLYGVIFAIGSFMYIRTIPDFMYESSYNFLKIQDLALNFGVYVDNLSIFMLLTVTIITLIVQLYSSSYMFKDKSFPRFFAYLNLFSFSMIGLILSPNLFQNYVFWELVGVSSYLLIGFWYKKPSAATASRKAFLMNRIGDVGLLIGTISISYFMYQYSNSPALASVPFENLSDISNYLYSFTNDFIFNFICVCLLFGAIAKSAQFPLHTWLADAMEGPTPVSALIHSATMVAAGVYLIARLYPIFSLSDEFMKLVSYIGLITALSCAFFAITQNDIKKILAYSTNSQLGLMFLALGAGAYSGGLYHLMTHAYFKSMLFLCAGVIIHSLLGQQDIRFMGGLKKKLPATALCYFIACLSASGLFFSGFYSKEMILSELIFNNHMIFACLFLLISFITALYMFKSYFLIFEGSFTQEKEIKKQPIILNLSILVLMLFTAFIGVFTHGGFKSYILTGNFLPMNGHEINFSFISILVSLSGAIFAFLFYGPNHKFKAKKVPFLYPLSFNKFYIDNFYDYLSKRLYLLISRVMAVFDKYVIDGLVSLFVILTRVSSWCFSKMQTGNFQTYLAYSVAFLAMIFTGLMVAYTMIIQYSLLSGG